LPMSTEETFSINAAAKLTGFTIPTIRKRLPELEKAGAQLLGTRWAIPLSALFAVGLMSKVDSKTDKKLYGQTLQGETINELTSLRSQLADALQRAAVAEAIASEREKALERADRALLMIESGTTTSKPRRRWFS
jgi:hypothetical protein